MGPLPSRYLELENDLIGLFAAELSGVENSAEGAPGETARSPEELAHLWVSEALALEAWRAQPLPPSGPPPRGLFRCAWRVHQGRLEAQAPHYPTLQDTLVTPG